VFENITNEELDECISVLRDKYENIKMNSKLVEHEPIENNDEDKDEDNQSDRDTLSLKGENDMNENEIENNQDNITRRKDKE